MKKITHLVVWLFLGVIFSIPSCVISDEDQVGPEDPRDKFLGTWKVSESCTRGNYSVYISYDPSNGAQVLIEGFGNPGPDYDPAVGLVTSGKVYVSSQTIGEGWMVSGTGTYKSDGTISWTYQLKISGIDYSCTAEYWK